MIEGIVGLGLIIPGAILTVFGGFLVYHGKGDLSTVLAAASIGAIQRNLLTLEEQGGDKYFGEPALNIEDLMQTGSKGKG